MNHRLTLRRRALQILAGPCRTHDAYYGFPIERQEAERAQSRHPALDGAVYHADSGIPTLGCVLKWAAAVGLIAALFLVVLMTEVQPFVDHMRPVSADIERRVG